MLEEMGLRVCTYMNARFVSRVISQVLQYLLEVVDMLSMVNTVPSRADRSIHSVLDRRGCTRAAVVEHAFWRRPCAVCMVYVTGQSVVERYLSSPSERKICHAI
jgi:hypothetical protein